MSVEGGATVCVRVRDALHDVWLTSPYELGGPMFSAPVLERVAVEQPQETLEALLKLQSEGAALSTMSWAATRLLKEKVGQLELECVWDALLQRGLGPVTSLEACHALVGLFAAEEPVPAAASARATSWWGGCCCC
jgi:hypothetical protein